MAVLQQPGQSGTLESNDIVVTVAPAEKGQGVALELTSIVMAQFGEQIRDVIQAAIKEQGVTDCIVKANDRGALDCTIRARVLTALSRAGVSVREAI